MHAVTLRAHFDGKQIVLDEPYELKRDTRLIITVLPENKVSDEREAWLHFSRKGLDNAFSEDEPEYTLDMIRRQNPMSQAIGLPRLVTMVSGIPILQL